MSLFDSNTYTGFNPNVINTMAYPQTRMMVPNPPMISAAARDLEKVNGLESAKQYQMPPNSRVALFDANDDIFYVKETDSSGFPTIRTFRFVEDTATPQPVEEVKYVTMEEFNTFKEELLNGQQLIRTETKSESTNNASTKSKSKKYDADVQSIK